jgi:hypothetical protein
VTEAADATVVVADATVVVADATVVVADETAVVMAVVADATVVVTAHLVAKPAAKAEQLQQQQQQQHHEKMAIAHGVDVVGVKAEKAKAAPRHRRQRKPDDRRGAGREAT